LESFLQPVKQHPRRGDNEADAKDDPEQGRVVDRVHDDQQSHKAAISGRRHVEPTTLLSSNLIAALTGIAAVIVLAESIPAVLRHPHRHHVTLRLTLGLGLLAAAGVAMYELYEGRVLAASLIGLAAGLVALPNAAYLERLLRHEEAMTAEEHAKLLQDEGSLRRRLQHLLVAALVAVGAIGSLHA
jgi:hypothetical protein